MISTVRPEWIMQMRTAAEELGSPVFGLLGPHAGAGVVNGYGGRPCSQMTLLYRTADGRVEVTTGTKPLGGTDSLVRHVIMRSLPQKVRLPWSVCLDERLVMLPVEHTPTQFRVVTASTGDWLATGGMKKRHLLLTGTAGVSVDDLRLGPVALNFDT